MKTVYLLHHIHVLREGDEDFKLIGAFSSRENAIAATVELSQEDGFKGRSQILTTYGDESGFYVSEVPLDEVIWKGGFPAPVVH